MPAQPDRIPVIYTIDAKTGEIHRKKGDGDQVLEDKVVARYDEEKRTVTFPNMGTLRNYKSGVITFLAENEISYTSFQLGDIKADGPLVAKNIPPRPRKTSTEGDKTPAVVEWYSRHRPNEFKARYGVLGTYTGIVRYQEPVWEPRPVDKVPEYRGTQWVTKEVTDVIVALRKTHLTFTPEECCGDEATGVPAWADDDPEAVPTDRGDERVSPRTTKEDES